MNIHDFHSWLHQRDRQEHDHVPVTEKVVPLIVQAGPVGLSRAEIIEALGDSLDRDALAGLLATFVESGLLTTSRQTRLYKFFGFCNSGPGNFTTP